MKYRGMAKGKNMKVGLKLRRAQTTIEYSLIMLARLFVFTAMYRSLQWYLAKEFRTGGIIILRMYKENPL